MGFTHNGDKGHFSLWQCFFYSILQLPELVFVLLSLLKKSNVL